MADSSQPYHDALHALTKLPRLRVLGVVFRGSASGCALLEGFSNLSNVLLFGLTITRQLVDDLKRLLAKSPSITTLTLNAHPQGPGETEVDKVDLASLFEDAIEPPINTIAGGEKSSSFSSTLEYLSISATHFKLSPSCTPFLHALTGLLISGDSAQTLEICQLCVCVCVSQDKINEL